MITQSFSPHSPAKIQPRPAERPLSCTACILTFSHVIEAYVLAHYPHRAFARLEQSSGPLWIYEIQYQGHRLAFCKTTIGAPAAVGLLEEAAMQISARRFVVFGGAGCLTHGEKNKAEVDKYGREAMEKTIGDAVSILGV